MHILLTDIVSCPRCGPEFGLIVLADRMEDRRVIEGRLGCANCREEYPVRDGVADLRRDGPAGAASIPGAAPGPDAERGYRVAALLGVTGPAGPVAVVTGDAALVEEVQRHLPDAGVVGVSEEPPAGGAGGMGWVLARGALPFRSGTLGGIALVVGEPAGWVGEAVRAVGRNARLVVDPAGNGVAAELENAGAELLLQQDGVAVASASRGG